MDKQKKSTNYFNSTFNCAQSTAVVFSDEAGLSEELILKALTGFGGGLAAMQKTCGAVTGAYFIIGLKNGKYQISDTSSKDITYKMIRKFNKEFTQRFGSLECLDLVGCNWSTEEGRRKYTETNLRKHVCEKCVAGAVEILEKLLK